jgi:pyruvate formate lyase activating enzyme
MTQPDKDTKTALFFGDGYGTAMELEVPVAPRRRTGAGLSGVDIEANLDRHDKLAMMRSGELGSIHSWELVTAVDGPGTRLTVFFNGCPLRCLYCHNPDTFEMRDGEPVTATEVLKKIRRYVPVFKATKGGITLSGGEVLMQPAFAAKILRGAKEMGVHTALDTSGYLGRSLTDDMMNDVDLVLLDVKSGHPETYKKLTGRELEPTLEFGRRLARAGLPGGIDPEDPVEIWLRFVVVPGYTDAEDNVEIIAEYAKELNDIRPGTISRVEILPFHQMGEDKWKELGLPYALEGVKPPSSDLVERVRNQFRAKGLTTF